LPEPMRALRGTALARVRQVAEAKGVAGVVLTRPGPVAWATAGMNPPIDRTAAIDTVWLAIGPEHCTVIITEVERDRIEAELLPADVGLVAVPWWDAQAMVDAAAASFHLTPAELGSDGHEAFGHDLSHDLTVARIVLSEEEQAELRSLGRDAARAVEDALRVWQPGETDQQIAARIAGAVEAVGADSPVLLVGADDRLTRFRHPVAVGAVTEHVVMAVLVARRRGLHVALTRYVAGGPTPELDAALVRVRAIHRAVLAAGVAGASYGKVLTVLEGTYRQAGQPDAWREHYQGGPIGYAQREFEISPAQDDSPWWTENIRPGIAVAWNPSLAGGAKDEDTYLINSGGVELITTTSDWPTDGHPALPRPGVLRLGHAARESDERNSS